MTRRRIVTALLAAVPLALLAGWVANHTYWEEVKVPMPPKGEALVNPFYATQRFAERLGARTAWDRMLVVPDSNAVLVISTWHWSLTRNRRAALERWVESGGRLVVDNRLVEADEAFENWTGIVRRYPDWKNWKGEPDPACRKVTEEVSGRPAASPNVLWLCDLGMTWLESTRVPEWALRDNRGIQAMRMRIGRGRVTVINAAPFVERTLFEGEHGRLFAAATELRRGDEVRFLSEEEFPSLPALIWRHGAPVVALGLTLLAALLWRGASRFGPLAAPSAAARRSLADQIRGTGRFALQHGGGESLHAASLRALEQAAGRRISGYAVLSGDQRLAALARATGFDAGALAAAVHHSGRSAAGELRRAIVLLEAARRELLAIHTKGQHGTR